MSRAVAKSPVERRLWARFFRALERHLQGLPADQRDTVLKAATGLYRRASVER